MSNQAEPSESERIYYTDSYAQVFSSRVVRVISGPPSPGVLLERTAFYPESGGQPADRGHLGECRVVEVADTDEGVLHLLDRDPPPVGAAVTGTIDWARRFDHMQQHTGQHILSQAFVEVIGAATCGFHMGETVSTIDLEADSVSDQELHTVELLANRVVFEDRLVEVGFFDSSEQEALGLRKPSERAGRLRIVKVGGFDRSACGGTHVRRTGEVGLIKIRRQERVRQKVRLEFVCGFRALADYSAKNQLVNSAAQRLSISESDLGEALERQIEQIKSLRREVSQTQERLLEFEAARAGERARRLGDREIVSGVWEGLDMGQLNRLASLILRDSPARIVLLGGRSRPGFLLFARSRELSSIDLRPLMAQAASQAGGRGGGSPDRTQAGSCDPNLLDQAIEGIVKELEANQ